jgi:hypothetical protein
LSYDLVLERVAALSEQLEGEARVQAERVVELCRELELRQRADGKLQPEGADLERKKELGRLSELLGRRTSRALPAASLGRAALADLSMDLRSFASMCADCDAKLQLWE